VCVDVGDDVARPFYRRHGAVDLNKHWMVWNDIAIVLEQNGMNNPESELDETVRRLLLDVAATVGATREPIVHEPGRLAARGDLAIHSSRFHLVAGFLVATALACDSRPPETSRVQQAAPSAVQSAQDIAKQALPSVVVVEMTDANGTPVALGSGFLVGEDLVATNHHVVATGLRGSVALLGDGVKHPISGIAGLDPDHDIAVLKVEQVRARSLVLGHNVTVEIGQKVYVVGNPHGLAGTFSEGIVSGVRGQGPDTLIQITAPISPGSSGGPVLDESGRVIGVATATLKGGQNLNFAVPSVYASRALSRAAGKVQPLAVVRGSRPTLKGAGPEPRVTDGVVGTEFVWESAVEFDLILPYHGSYSLTLRNKLDVPIESVRMIVVFKNSQGEPIEISAPRDGGPIPPKLARRVSGKVAGEVQSLTTTDGSRRPRPGRIEIRVLDYQVGQ
jgi:S1-C subfamily serine protease